MHKRKQVKPNFMIAVRMWSIYKILSWRDWLSLRSHTDDLQMLFLYSFVEEEGILVLHGIFRFGGCHEISLLKSLHACQKFIWFFKCNTTSMSHRVMPLQLSCFVISWEQKQAGPASLGTTYVQTHSCHLQGLGQGCRGDAGPRPALGWGEWGNVF